jgi:hypothetical protein
MMKAPAILGLVVFATACGSAGGTASSTSSAPSHPVTPASTTPSLTNPIAPAPSTPGATLGLDRIGSCAAWEDGVVLTEEDLAHGCASGSTVINTVRNLCPDGTTVYVSDIGWGRSGTPFHAGAPPDTVTGRCA